MHWTLPASWMLALGASRMPPAYAATADSHMRRGGGRGADVHSPHGYISPRHKQLVRCFKGASPVTTNVRPTVYTSSIYIPKLSLKVERMNRASDSSGRDPDVRLAERLMDSCWKLHDTATGLAPDSVSFDADGRLYYGSTHIWSVHWSVHWFVHWSVHRFVHRSVRPFIRPLARVFALDSRCA